MSDVRPLLFSLALAMMAMAPVAAPARAAEAGDELDLEALFNTAQVGIATKGAQSAHDAPAIVDVVTAEELHERGYQSVVEAQRAMPGFYVVDDHLLPNVGVRGISSGQRSWSRLLKLMIDGQPVPYQPDGSNWLGPELIPLDLIQAHRGDPEACLGPLRRRPGRGHGDRGHRPAGCVMISPGSTSPDFSDPAKIDGGIFLPDDPDRCAAGQGDRQDRRRSPVRARVPQAGDPQLGQHLW